VIAVTFVGLAAVATRLAFLVAVVDDKPTQQILGFAPDSREYYVLARRLAETGMYAKESVQSRHIGLVRTPGYPAYCSVFFSLGAPLTAILWTQAVLGSVTALMTALLAWWMFRRVWGCMAAGMCAAFSLTGVGLTGVLLTEVLFTTLFLGGFLLLWSAVARAQLLSALLAGVLFGLANLVRPSLIAWPVMVLLLCPLLARSSGRSTVWSHVLVIAVLQLAFIAVWCCRNYVAEGTFVFSSVGERNLRYISAPLIEEWGKAGTYPAKADVYANYSATKERLDAALLKAHMSPAQFAQLCRRESIDIIRRYPHESALTYVHNLGDALCSGYDMFKRQLARADFGPAQGKSTTSSARAGLHTAVITPLERVGTGLHALSWSPWMRATGAIVVTAGLMEVILMRILRRGGARWDYRLVALLATYAYFLALAGTVYRGGSRLMYPVQFVPILLAVGVVTSLIELSGSRAVPRSTSVS
jgi:4-amino-4-deoxy-L-arabinose transferase-like glycosyltransferase